MEDNVNTEVNNEELDLSECYDDNISDSANLIVKGVAGVIAGVGVAIGTSKLIKRAKAKKAAKEQTPKEEKPKKKLQFQSPVKVVLKEKKEEEEAE